MEGIDPPNFKEDDPIRGFWFSSIFNWVRRHTGVISVTTTYTVAENVYWVRADATAAPFTVTLPDATIWTGRRIGVKKIDATGNAVSVATADAATQSLAAQYARVIVISNGATWDVEVKQ